MHRSIMSLFLMLIFVVSGISQENTKAQKLTWEPVVGAGSYEVTIQNEEGKVLLKKRISENLIEVELPAGKYRFKVQVFNKFSKPMTESPWSNLEIKRTYIPDILTYEPQFFYQNSTNTVLLIKGQGFLPESLVYLEKGTQRIEGKILEIEKNWIVKVSFDIQGKPVGKYSLVIQNPLDLTFQKGEGFEIKLSQKPSVKDVTPKSFAAGLIYKDVLLTGNNFEPGMTVEFHSGDTILKPLFMTEQSQTQREFYLDLSESSSGTYDIIISNPDGKSFSFPKQFTISNPQGKTGSVIKPVNTDKLDTKPEINNADLKPRISLKFPGLPPKSTADKTPFTGSLLKPITRPEIEISNGNKTQDNQVVSTAPPKEMPPQKENFPPGNGAFTILTGYSSHILISGLSSSFNPSFLGGNLELFFDMDNGTLREIPILNGIGLGLEGAFWSFEGTPNSVGNLSMKLLHTGIFLYVSPRWDLPWDFHIRTGLGISSSWVSLAMTSTSIDAASNDFYLMAGLDGEIVLRPLIIKLGADYRKTFFLNRVSDGITLTGGVGLRF